MIRIPLPNGRYVKVDVTSHAFLLLAALLVTWGTDGNFILVFLGLWAADTASAIWESRFRR